MQFPRLFDLFPYPVTINTAATRLADLFRNNEYALVPRSFSPFCPSPPQRLSLLLLQTEHALASSAYVDCEQQVVLLPITYYTVLSEWASNFADGPPHTESGCAHTHA